MGEFGSGRYGWKRKAEHVRSLDVCKMERSGVLEPGYLGGWQWTRDGEQVASIDLCARNEHVVLTFRYRDGQSDWQLMEQVIRLASVPCHFGGERRYFVCPGGNRPCGRRIAKLFAGGPLFLCRHCYHLVYASQSETEYDRLLRQANKRRIALGGEPGAGEFPPRKPKGMWRRTYKRRIAEIQDFENRASQAFIGRFGHVLSASDLELLHSWGCLD